MSETNVRGRWARRTGIGSVLLLGTAFAVVAGPQTSAEAAARPTCFGHVATIVGGAKGTTIRGTKGDDVIYAGNGNDTVYGLAGNDLICGGYGADRLHGGAGNDWLDGQQGAKVRTAAGTRIDGDLLYAEGGHDFLSPAYDGRYPTRTPDRITFAAAASPVTVNTATHSSSGGVTATWLGNNAEIVGSAKGDTFLGGPDNDTFQGGAGADTMSGGAGDDVLRDDYDGAHRKDADRLSGGVGDDQLFTQGGFDRLDGGDGNDLLSDYGRDAGSMVGGTGNDVINDGIAISAAQVDDGGPGVDTVSLYTDMLRPSWPRLAADLSRGTGTFRTSAATTFTLRSADNLYVHGLPLTFIGDAGNNLVWSDGTGGLDATGNAGNDTFIGSLGYDSFDGGPGADRATTNGGPDVCVGIESMIGRCTAG